MGSGRRRLWESSAPLYLQAVLPFEAGPLIIATFFLRSHSPPGLLLQSLGGVYARGGCLGHGQAGEKRSPVGHRCVPRHIRMC